MAKSELLIPHIFFWEDSVPKSYASRPFEEQFAKAKEKGLVILPQDKGGPTVCGIILSTFQEYNKLKGLPLGTSQDLIHMSPQTWLDIYKTLFWDKCGGDQIEDQRVANMFVDWVWTSGRGQIKKVQKLVGIPDSEIDGIVGPKTLEILNSWHPVILFEELKQLRTEFYRQLVVKMPSQQRFLKGWLNRVNDL